jgi:hypothetical protein
MLTFSTFGFSLDPVIISVIIIPRLYMSYSYDSTPSLLNSGAMYHLHKSTTMMYSYKSLHIGLKEVP